MAAKNRRTSTILAVEDDPVIRSAIQRALTGRVDVVFAASGKAALQALDDHADPAFILLDYRLPDMDGLRVLEQVRSRARSKTLPVVMFSSLSDPGHVRSALANGANSWVTKTDDPDAFEAAVQAICSYWLHMHTHA